MLTLGERVARMLGQIGPAGEPEARVREALEAALRAAGHPVRRGVVVHPQLPIEFLVRNVGVHLPSLPDEPTALEERLHRFAQSDLVSEIVLVARRVAHLGVSRQIHGKPCWVAWPRQR